VRIIWITGMPRSGTSWLGKIFAAHPEVLYHFEPFDDKPERKKNPHSLKFYGLIDKIQQVERSRAEVRQAMLYSALEQFWRVRDHNLDREPYFGQPDQPRMMVIKSPKIMPVADVAAHFGQIIYIMRDPRAVISSLWRTQFGKSYPAAGTARRWAQRSDHFLALAESSPELYTIVRFEELVKFPVEMAKKLCEWADLPWAIEQERFISRSHQGHRNHPHAVIKNPDRVLGAWKKHLSGAAQRIVVNNVAGSSAWRKLYTEGENR